MRFAQLTPTYTAYPANSIFGTGMETAIATEKRAITQLANAQAPGDWHIEVTPGMPNPVRSGERLKFVDVNPATNLAGGKPICGTVTISDYEPDLFGNNDIDETTDTRITLQHLFKSSVRIKIQALNKVIQDIDSWVLTWPDTTQDSVEAWEAIDTNHLNRIVAEANTMVGATISYNLDNNASLKQGVGLFIVFNRVLKNYFFRCQSPQDRSKSVRKAALQGSFRPFLAL
ncbi:MAG: hypothetical protein FWF12_09160 [Betaproteobacteria bacterium]|nr:hypothetical protein [Betaproteobacteria bacterium]